MLSRNNKGAADVTIFEIGKNIASAGTQISLFQALEDPSLTLVPPLPRLPLAPPSLLMQSRHNGETTCDKEDPPLFGTVFSLLFPAHFTLL